VGERGRAAEWSRVGEQADVMAERKRERDGEWLMTVRQGGT
jgi:hypothetical protein